MTNTTSNASASNANVATPASDTKQILLKEIRTKWIKFSEHDLSALKGNDDLVTQLAAKYSLDKPQAQRDVDALMKGRHI
jgi:hypothetical protein